jgi:hypothetical protein
MKMLDPNMRSFIQQTNNHCAYATLDKCLVRMFASGLHLFLSSLPGHSRVIIILLMTWGFTLAPGAIWWIVFQA